MADSDDVHMFYGSGGKQKTPTRGSAGEPMQNCLRWRRAVGSGLLRFPGRAGNTAHCDRAVKETCTSRTPLTAVRGLTDASYLCGLEPLGPLPKSRGGSTHQQSQDSSSLRENHIINGLLQGGDGFLYGFVGRLKENDLGRLCQQSLPHILDGRHKIRRSSQEPQTKPSTVTPSSQ